MKPVMQSDTKSPGGDCLRACVASILELSLEEVPNFCGIDPPHDWCKRLADWLFARNLGVIGGAADKLHMAVPGVCILGVRTHKSSLDWGHAVVGQVKLVDGAAKIKVIHDPHPNPAEISKVLEVFWIVRNVDAD